MNNQKVVLSTVWLVAILNYFYCDLLGLMDANLLRQFLAGSVDGLEFTQGFLLGASVLMEIPIAMVLLARVLPYGANRWANIIAGAIMTIVQIGSLFFGSSPTIYYIFFSVIEISCTVFIIVCAWRWKEPQGVVVPAT